MMSKSVTPLADEQVRKVLEFGAKKHGNIEVGREINWKEYLNHAERHLHDYWAHKRWRQELFMDRETGQHPLSHTIARLKILLEYELRQEKE